MISHQSADSHTDLSRAQPDAWFTCGQASTFWKEGDTSAMSALARIERILEGLSEDRIRQLIDFARFLALEQERQEWLGFGQQQLARAYGSDEPD